MRVSGWDHSSTLDTFVYIPPPDGGGTDVIVNCRMKELPIACELSPAELQARREGLLTELLARAQESVPLSNGFRWRFTPSTEVLLAAAKTIDAERQCCRFLKFALTVEPDAGDVGWTSLALTALRSSSRRF